MKPVGRTILSRVLGYVIDSCVEAWSPRMAWDRSQIRGQSGGLRSGSWDGRLGDWSPPSGDANAVTINDLTTVRDRSRDAALNNPIAQAVRRIMADYVVDRGLKPQCLIDYDRLGISEQQAQDWQGACEAFYECESKKADVTGKCDMPALQRLIYLSMWDGGDVFVSYPMVADDDGRVGTRINLIEAERVDTPPEGYTDPLVNGGVATDKWAKPRGYWVYRGHPGDRKPNRLQMQFEFWSRIRAGRLNIVQLFHQDRIGQSRGIPGFAQGLPLIDQINEYVEDVAIQAQIQTRLGFFIETAADPFEAGKSMGKDFYKKLQGRGIAPGSVNLIRKGDSVNAIGATAPGQYFDPFLVRLQRIIAACIGAPYEILFGDIAAANFSSIRAGFLSFRKKIQGEQDILIPALQAYWDHIIYEGWLDGMLGDVGKTVPFESDRAAWARVKWVRPAPGYVDPTKEFSAYKIALDNGMMSLSQVIAEGGGNVMDTLRQIARDQRVIRELGIVLPGMSGPKPAGQADQTTGKQPQPDQPDPADQTSPDQQDQPDNQSPPDESAPGATEAEHEEQG